MKYMVDNHGKNDAVHFKDKVHFYQTFSPKCLANKDETKTQTHESLCFTFMSIQQSHFC